MKKISKEDKENYLYLEKRKEWNRYHRFGKVVAFDTEAYKIREGNDIIYTFRNADFFDGKNHYYTESKDEVEQKIKEIVEKVIKERGDNAKVTIIAHNIEFDLRNSGLIKVLWEKELIGYPLKGSLIIDDNFYLSFGTVDLLDTFNYFKYSEREMGKLEGLEKILTEEEYNLPPEQWNPLIEKRGEEVVKRDTEILWKHFYNFRKTQGNVGISISQTALLQYQTKYMPVDYITMPKAHEQFIRASYRGGRTEAYYIKEPLPFVYLDINSLYPTVMKMYNYAYKFYKEYDSFSIEHLESDINNWSFFVLCDYEFPNDLERLPIVVKTKLEDGVKLTQKYSATNVWLTGREVLQILKESGNVKIHKVLMYYSTNLFYEFVDNIYRLREIAKKRAKETEGTPEESKYKVLEKFYKLILNSLYGKFGQKAIERIVENEEVFLNMLEDLTNENERVVRKKINNMMWSFHGSFATAKNTKNAKSSYPVMVSAEITANARLFNWEFQKKFGIENVYMTDTDSFVINPKVPYESYIGDELGMLKREYYKNGEQYILILAPKYYKILDANYQIVIDPKTGEPEYKSKGIPKNAIQVEEYRYKFPHIQTLLETVNPTVMKEVWKERQIKLVNNKLRYVQRGKGLWGLPLY